jgi:hypothetical protein
MSVRLHYPEVFDGSSGIDKIDNLDDQTESFSDFEQRLDWTFRMAGYADKRHIAEWPTQAK